MFEFFQALGASAVTVFVVTSMLDLGLTQKPSRPEAADVPARSHDD